MKRGKQSDYIQNRILDLLEEGHKAHDHRDKQWYLRCAQELQWCHQYLTGTTGASCVIKEYETTEK